MVAAFIALGFAVMSFVSLAFNFLLLTDGSNSSSLKMSTWNEVLKLDTKGTELWQFSRVLMYIALVVIAVTAVLAFVQLFVEHKVLALTTKIAGIVSIVLAPLFLICFSVGGFMYMSNSYGSSIILPNVGPILLTVFGLVSAIFALISNKKRKERKAK